MTATTTTATTVRHEDRQGTALRPGQLAVLHVQGDGDLDGARVRITELSAQGGVTCEMLHAQGRMTAGEWAYVAPHEVQVEESQLLLDMAAAIDGARGLNRVALATTAMRGNARVLQAACAELGLPCTRISCATMRAMLATVVQYPWAELELVGECHVGPSTDWARAHLASMAISH